MIKKLIKKIIFFYKYRGKKVVIKGDADFSCKFKGNNVVGKRTEINNTELGFCSYVAADSRINNVIVGNFCSIGPGVRIGLGRHPVRDFVSTHPAFYSANTQCGLSFSEGSGFSEIETIMIGGDVWIGANAIVMDGVFIGDGAVIAAGSVVTKNVADFEIVGGVPAHNIGYRFDKEEISYLQTMKWWQCEDEVKLKIKCNSFQNFALFKKEW
ncbi:CatB-related O-acetyltransferase [Amphritea atlantica]|uniref:CatB-related O-acetyltransferase n=1 Tax=Amphritea atlantica TaxID=355243 RepID=A0ABY5GRE3_9GAMM|nr:CatB-related O-acetyltransferase [Amphritea atlantica]